MGPLRYSHRKTDLPGRVVSREQLHTRKEEKSGDGNTELDPGLRGGKSSTSGSRRKRMTKPHGRLVSVSSTPCGAYTSDLSTSSSSTALQGDCSPGGLVSRFASRLDAFSGYRIRTLLPSDATGVTTGTQAVRPTRSSRTKVRSSQASCAHSR